MLPSSLLPSLLLASVLMCGGCPDAAARHAPNPSPEGSPVVGRAPVPNAAEGLAAPAPVNPPPSATPATPESPPPELELARRALRSRQFARAEALLETACHERGEAQACMLLGQLLEDGRPGLKADPERAIGLFSEACAGELQQACDRLGH